MAYLIDLQPGDNFDLIDVINHWLNHLDPKHKEWLVPQLKRLNLELQYIKPNLQRDEMAFVRTCIEYYYQHPPSPDCDEFHAEVMNCPRLLKLLEFNTPPWLT